MLDDRPESIIIQLKEGVRHSNDLDSALDGLASLQAEKKMEVVKRWAGVKYLELVAFQKGCTAEEAMDIVAELQALDYVEKVVTASAFNLEFRSGDFAREFEPTSPIPDAAKRGFDADRHARGAGPSVASMVAQPHTPSRIIVRWKDENVWNAAQTGFLATVAAINSQNGLIVIDERSGPPATLIQTLEPDPNAATRVPRSVTSLLNSYLALESVDYAQPDYIYSAHAPGCTPNDPGYPNQWGLPKISAPQAWCIHPPQTTGTDANIVAIGDTGANGNHPDFVTNLWGGYNFVSNNGNYADDNGHGSNVAAIVGAQGNNGVYLTGVAWDVRLMHLKCLDVNGSGTTFNIARAIAFAWDPAHHAIAINLSLGSGRSGSIDLALRDALRDARTNDMVVVSSAGNGDPGVGIGFNSDLAGNLVSPASIPTDNNIAVGATDMNDNRPVFSNYGQYRVELGAPGVQIYGLTQALGFYSIYSGTSQAAPHVTGTLQLAKSYFPWENYAGLRDRVLMATDDVPALNGVFRTGGRLNAWKALQKRTMLRNLSTRARVESGERIMIGGFVIGGSGTLKVALRGMGPSLPNFSVPKLGNPKITLLNSSGQALFANDDWGNLPAGQLTDLANSGLTPTNPNEAAMVQTLPPGAYTLWVESQDGQFGIGLFEIYELQNVETIRLLNVSTRCIVNGTGEEVAIAGTIIGESTSIPKRRVLSFGKGPSLPVFGKIPNPTLEFRNSSGGLVASNDQWQTIDGTSTGLEDKLVEANFAPANGNESAVWPTLTWGAYTAILKDAGGANGIGLVELYEY